ncbi:nucleotidyltransferase domain-containing protein [Candidatus Woesearchaeota archaeon]|nr:nucleotidyltransferase domain-containing protein [Candidatus Woesearchaeota archaeon]
MLQKCSIFNVAGVFFREPTQDHYLLEISKKADLSHTSTKICLQTLIKLSIIKESIEKKGSRKFPIFRANLNSKIYKHYKKIYNLLELQNSGLIEFLKDSLMPKCIVLFGSYQRGEDVEDSDIDLFLECKEEKVDLSKFAKMLNRNIQLHFKEHFKRYPDELKNNIINGMVVEGYLEAL